MSHDNTHPMEIPPNTEQVPRISSIGDTYVILTNGRQLDVDAIIFCTGYKYDFGFLAPECGVLLENEHIQHLYKHIFNIRHPTMSFIGILKRVLLFRCSYMQAEIVCGVLKGRHVLPTEESMLQDEEEQMRAIAADIAPHEMFGRLETAYYEEMRKLFGIEFWPEGVVGIYDRVAYDLIGIDGDFKDINFVLSPDKKSYKELPKHASLDNYGDGGELFNGDI